MLSRSIPVLPSLMQSDFVFKNEAIQQAQSTFDLNSHLQQQPMKSMILASAATIFGAHNPQEVRGEADLLSQKMPSRDVFNRNSHRQSTKIRGLRNALDEMVDHINDATAGEFGSFSLFEMDNTKKGGGR